MNRKAFGKIKWFGGYNSQTGKDNNYGFIEESSGLDVYLNKRDWQHQTPPYEGQYVFFQIISSGNDKYSAESAVPLSKIESRDLLEKLVSLESIDKCAPSEQEYFKPLVSAFSNCIAGKDIDFINNIFHKLDVPSGVLDELKGLPEWHENRVSLERAGVASEYFQAIREEELKEKLAKQLERELEEKRRLVEASIFDELDKDFIGSFEKIKDIDTEGLVDSDEALLKWARERYLDDRYASLSDEQIRAILDCSNTTLLRARAGSGKTTVIKHKVDFMIKRLAIKPSEIMVLAFNAEAAAKVKNELRKDFGHPNFSNARTFHSLAYQIVRPTEELLFDEDTGHNAKQSQLVQEIIQKESNPAFLDQMYEFFRSELKEMETTGSLLDKKDYYQMVRSSTQETLNGEAVKSIGEKWIADFLFEHGIKYMYERAWYLDKTGEKGNYYPDFSLAVSGRRPDVVIEHWGIDENDAAKSVPPHWNKSWEEYRANMQEKREYWREFNKEPGQDVLFLETSIADMRNGRSAFENKLKRLLEEHGVLVKRLSREALVEKITRKNISRFSNMCLQFITISKKQKLKAEEVKAKIQKYSGEDEKEKIFISIASKIFGLYELELKRSNKIDFDDLMLMATDTVRACSGKLTIRNGPEDSTCLNELKWLLIDEYQDFSLLFFDLVIALRELSGEFRLFCVGDDWQAINGFAGSDLVFFEKFENKFIDAVLLDLQNNYRSQKNIVDAGNKFMSGKDGLPSIAKADLNEEVIKKIYTNKIFIEQRASELQGEDPDFPYKTQIFRNGRKTDIDVNGYMARMFKACHLIMCSFDLGETDFMILNRNNRLAFGYENMGSFKSKLKGCFSKENANQFKDFDSQVKCTTAHQSKGGEADVVIILNVLQRKFPIIHPNNELYKILSISTEKVYMEEERLFYVSITRAKKNLFFLTEFGQESEFLSRIPTREYEISGKYGFLKEVQGDVFSVAKPSKSRLRTVFKR